MAEEKMIKKFGHVEIWQNADTQAVLSPKTSNHLQTPDKMLNWAPGKAKEYSAEYILPLVKLQNAIRLAPEMARVATDRIRHLIMDRHIGRGSVPISTDQDTKFEQTAQGLFKYFNLPPNLRDLGPTDPAWATAEKIYNVFELTLAGLRQPYRIYLFEHGKAGASMADDAHGFVRVVDKPAKLADHPLHIYFSTPPDENGHVPFPPMLQTRYIHLSMEGMKKAAIDNSKAGRLLLHEATHKFATTTDVCYKFQTIAQKYKHQEWTVPAEKQRSPAKQLGYAISDGKQSVLLRPNRPKPLLSMALAGVNKADWVMNADSYACLARRLWKQETGRGAQAYIGYSGNED